MTAEGTVWFPFKNDYRGPSKVIRGTVTRPVDLDRLSLRVKGLVKGNYRRGWITRNSACCCGSGKRFKRCCMNAA